MVHSDPESKNARWTAAAVWVTTRHRDRPPYTDNPFTVGLWLGLRLGLGIGLLLLIGNDPCHADPSLWWTQTAVDTYQGWKKNR